MYSDYFLRTDVSKPLKNSLIHTSHGDTGGKSRGCPETIDVFPIISAGTDISKPLKNSLIHTGHGDPGGKSWGCPETIDE